MAAYAGAALLLFFALCATGLILSSLFRGKYASLAIAWFGTLCSIVLMAAAGLRLAAGVGFPFESLDAQWLRNSVSSSRRTVGDFSVCSWLGLSLLLFLCS